MKIITEAKPDKYFDVTRRAMINGFNKILNLEVELFKSLKKIQNENYN